jgi:hypothetical protein
MSEAPVLDPDLRFDAPGIKARRPRTRVKTEVATFVYDVEAVAEAAEGGEEPPLIAATTKVLFASGCLPLRINAATEQLLSLVSEGVLTVDEIADAFGTATDQCLSVLEGLYWEGIIEFDRGDDDARDSGRKEVPVTTV